MPTTWTTAGEYTDIRYEKSTGGAGPNQMIAKITINRPEVRNAFRPLTVIEISLALTAAQEDLEVGVIVLTGEGPLAFCAGGDQRVRGDSGYLAEDDGSYTVGPAVETLLPHRWELVIAARPHLDGLRDLDEVSALGLFLLGVLLGLGFVLLLGLDDIDAHFVHHGQNVFDLLGIDLLGGEHGVQFGVSDKAPLFGELDHPLDGGVG